MIPTSPLHIFSNSETLNSSLINYAHDSIVARPSYHLNINGCGDRRNEVTKKDGRRKSIARESLTFQHPL